MADFMIRFLICNILLCGIIGILLFLKRILKNCLSSRMQYNLWFLLLGLLAVPFLPFRFLKLSELFVWLKNLNLVTTAQTEGHVDQTLHTNITNTQNWMEDFTLSVNRRTPSMIGYLLLALWVSGLQFLFPINKRNRPNHTISMHIIYRNHRILTILIIRIKLFYFYIISHIGIIFYCCKACIS